MGLDSTAILIPNTSLITSDFQPRLTRSYSHPQTLTLWKNLRPGAEVVPSPEKTLKPQSDEIYETHSLSDCLPRKHNETVSSSSSVSTCSRGGSTSDPLEISPARTANTFVNLPSQIVQQPTPTLNTETITIPLALVSRHRHTLQFTLTPLPKDIGIIRTTVVKTSTGFQMFLPGDNSRSRVQVLEAVARKSPHSPVRSKVTHHYSRYLNKLSGRGKQFFDLFIGKNCATNVGQVKIRTKGKNLKSASVAVKSFRAALDFEKDQKGELVEICRDISEAPLHEICTAEKKPSGSNLCVSLDALIEADSWDSIQSISGYYGVSNSWPYRKSNETKSELISSKACSLEYTHQSLFNPGRRCLDFLGEKTDAFRCETKSSKNKTFQIIGESPTNNQPFLSITPESNSNTVSERFSVQFQWPMSPVQALGTFVILSASEHI